MRRKDLPDNYRKAWQSNNIKDFQFDLPEGWNSDLPPFTYQIKDAIWMYLAKKGINASQVGTGKTIEALFLTQLLKAREEPYRTVLVTRNLQTQHQWLAETQRFTNLVACLSDGEKADRVSLLSGWWEMIILRYPQLVRDYEYIAMQDFDNLILDEPTEFGAHHHDTKTAENSKRLAKNRERVFILDATPVQTFVGGPSLFNRDSPDAHLWAVAGV